MAIDQYFTDYIQETARIAIIHAKAAYPCKNHPDTLLLSRDLLAREKAYRSAIGTLVYNDKLFLRKYILEAVSAELSQAATECLQCLQYK